MTDRSLHFPHYIFRYTTGGAWSIVSSTANRSIYCDEQGAVCEDGGAPGAIEIKAAQDLSDRSYAVVVG